MTEGFNLKCVLARQSGVDGTRTRAEMVHETLENKADHARDGVIESSRLVTGDHSRPVVTVLGALSDADLTAGLVAAVAEKRWAIAEVLAAGVQQRQRAKKLRNVVPIADRRHRST